MILMNGEDLNDRHINFAQYLLHTQFPAMQGLVLTLLQEKTIATKLPAGSVQIIHNSRRHQWLVATTKNCTRNEVNLCIRVQMPKYAELLKTYFKPLVIHLLSC